MRIHGVVALATLILIAALVSAVPADRSMTGNTRFALITGTDIPGFEPDGWVRFPGENAEAKSSWHISGLVPYTQYELRFACASCPQAATYYTLGLAATTRRGTLVVSANRMLPAGDYVGRFEAVQASVPATKAWTVESSFTVTP